MARILIRKLKYFALENWLSVQWDQFHARARTYIHTHVHALSRLSFSPFVSISFHRSLFYFTRLAWRDGDPAHFFNFRTFRSDIARQRFCTVFTERLERPIRMLAAVKYPDIRFRHFDMSDTLFDIVAYKSNLDTNLWRPRGKIAINHVSAFCRQTVVQFCYTANESQNFLFIWFQDRLFFQFLQFFNHITVDIVLYSFSQ